MSAKVFITGGTGFLGSYIIKELVENGYSIRAIRRRNSRVPYYIQESIMEKVEWIEGDVLDVVSLEEGMEGMDIVIHSAAIISFLRSERKEMYKINIEGTANVVNAALEKNIKRFVHLSSVAALGRNTNGASINEEKKWEENKTNTHYARSKQKAELEIWRGAGEGLNTVILNPSTILGYGDWNFSSCTIFKNVYKEFGWYSVGVNGFVDVEDVAKATRLLMESTYTDRFIICGDNWPFKKLLETIAEHLEKNKPKRQITPFIFSLALVSEKIKSFFTGKKSMLSNEVFKIANSRSNFENEKVLKALPGFSFTPIGESIRKACEKYHNRVISMQPDSDKHNHVTDKKNQ